MVTSREDTLGWCLHAATVRCVVLVQGGYWLLDTSRHHDRHRQEFRDGYKKYIAPTQPRTN
eukprot:scaffold193_cov203-Alexandrium_tamarense.AAC.23